MAGKGSKPRITDRNVYRSNFGDIDWSKKIKEVPPAQIDSTPSEPLPDVSTVETASS